MGPPNNEKFWDGNFLSMWRGFLYERWNSTMLVGISTGINRREIFGVVREFIIIGLTLI